MYIDFSLHTFNVMGRGEGGGLLCEDMALGPKYAAYTLHGLECIKCSALKLWIIMSRSAFC